MSATVDSILAQLRHRPHLRQALARAGLAGPPSAELEELGEVAAGVTAVEVLAEYRRRVLADQDLIAVADKSTRVTWTNGSEITVGGGLAFQPITIREETRGPRGRPIMAPQRAQALEHRRIYVDALRRKKN